MPPKNRKFECGNDKRKKKKKIEELIQSQVGALDKFLIKEPQVSNESRYIDNIDNLPIENDNLDIVKGPKRDNSIVKGPRDSLNRRFTVNLYTRALANGEVCDRDWLVYSKELDRVFCFCCKVFKNGIVMGQLANDGYSDWVHVGERIKEHELGMEHVKNMTTWYEYRKRLQKFQTIDKTIQRLIEKEKDH
ncbi:uncharacterized protein LOC127121818 [Lathyrus oleraceus]|uniref:uncharacterized protein LOC127121818 n=1 Tax=Pisum sativum TaxID=3888 RepID=UPI0021CE6121|nr:uncharacterized protein LOC127121818 [Pisum sativum]